MASDTVAGELVKIALSTTASESVRVQAILAVLDRAGISARQQITIEASVETWETRVQAAVVDWGELGEYMPATEANGDVVDAEIVENDATEREWDRRLEGPHEVPVRSRPSEVERRVDALPQKAPAPEPTPPWETDETGSQHANRLADEHRRAAFAAEKASNGLTPRTTRPRRR